MKTQIDTTQYTAHKHPGKFEGESAATEYFYEQMLNGDGEMVCAYADWDDAENPDGESNEWQATIFTVQSEESEAFDLPIGATFMIREDSQGEAFDLPIGATFMIREDSQGFAGFVYGSVHASRDEAEAKFRAWLGL